ncbi:MAG: hypothetical protein IJT19_06505 [Bacteroidaceae bacterium]|nr:hypothetical protein [Bacteroidaceae bacterium]
MEKYILDTNTWIEHFHQRSGVTQHIMELPTTQLFVSEVTLAELTFGAYYSSDFEPMPGVKVENWAERE